MANFSSMVAARIDYGVGPVSRSVLVDWPSYGQSFDVPAATLRVSAVARPGAGLPANVGSVFAEVRFAGWAVPAPGGAMLATVTVPLGGVLEGDYSVEVAVPRGAREVTLWYSAFDPGTGAAYSPPLNTGRAVVQWSGNMVPGFGLTRYDNGAVGGPADIGNMSPLASVGVYSPVPSWARTATVYNPDPAVLLNTALQFRVAL